MSFSNLPELQNPGYASAITLLLYSNNLSFSALDTAVYFLFNNPLDGIDSSNDIAFGCGRPGVQGSTSKPVKSRTDRVANGSPPPAAATFLHAVLPRC